MLWYSSLLNATTAVIMLHISSQRSQQQNSSHSEDDKKEEEEDGNDDGGVGGIALLRRIRNQEWLRHQSVNAGGTFQEHLNNYRNSGIGNEEESKAMYIALKESEKSPEFMRMLQLRMSLPAWNFKDEILMLLKDNQVLVLSGDTGCGKSTQVPQFILENCINDLEGASCNIICTQPRKISAIGLADRVSSERCEKGGPGSETGLVGYQVRLQKRSTERTRLLYCTVGILLRRLVFDPNLENVSHVVVDEAHERQADMDFLLILLRELCTRRSDIRIVIMSATMREKDFSDYFGGVPCLTVSEGKRFPVEILYLEEAWKATKRGKVDKSAFWKQLSQQAAEPLNTAAYEEAVNAATPGLPPPSEPVDQELLLDLIKYIVLYDSSEGKSSSTTTTRVTGGGILCFLPGFADIDKLLRSIRSDPVLNGVCHSLGLHSSLSLQEQHSVFRPVPLPATWKVVASTNVAEASITIPDITHVIDSGRVKELGHNPMTGLSSLVEVWGSQASAKQRSGRAGRVGPGMCWRLYPRLMENRMLSYSIPEMLRVPLEDLLLQAMVLNAELPPESDMNSGHSEEAPISFNDPREILSRAMDAPPKPALDMALRHLVQLQACNMVDISRPGSSKLSSYSFDAVAAADSVDNIAVSLTPLGFHLSQLPVPCRVGKLLIMGVLFECLDPILIVAAAMSSKTPFLKPFGALIDASKAHATFEREADARSDHLAVVHAYELWSNLKNDRIRFFWCRRNYVGMEAMNTIKGLRLQFTHHLAAAGLVEMREDSSPSGTSKDNGGNSQQLLLHPKHSSKKRDKALLRCVLCSGLMPRVACFMSGKSASFLTKHDNSVSVHPSSVNRAFFQQSSSYGTGKSPLVVYHSKMRTTRTYMHDTTLITPFSLLLWGSGGSSGVRHLRKDDIASEKRRSSAATGIAMKKGNVVIEIDGWLRFQIDEEVAVIFKHLRSILNTALLQRILQPKSDNGVSSEGGCGQGATPTPLCVSEWVSTLLKVEYI